MDIFTTTARAIELINFIYLKCEEYHDADETIKSIRHRLDGVSVRLEIFQKYLRSQSSDLPARNKQVLHRSIERIDDLLHELAERLPATPTVSKRLVWIGWGKRRTERLLSDLKDWDEDVHRTIFALDILSTVRDVDQLYQRLFDTGDRKLTSAWALSRRIYESTDLPIPSLELQLQKVDVQPPYSLSDARSLGILSSSEAVYIEAHYIDRAGDLAKQKYEICRMAAVFNSPDLPTMHLLSCAGFAEDYTHDRCFLIYHLPDPTIPTIPTLGRALQRQARITLEDRFRIAVEIATAVFEIHAAGWVHKNIRSDNVLVNVSEDKKQSKSDATVGSVYVVGFEAARPQIRGSEQRPETDPDKRRYHHPERQGGRDSRVQRFDIRHDMYSLGAVLIEIGFRKTLHDMFGTSSRPSEPEAGEEEANHKRLVGYAQRLGDKMGSKYAHATLVCLTKTMDPGQPSENLREEFYDHVLRPLREVMNGMTKGIVV